MARPRPDAVLLLVQIEVAADDETPLEVLGDLLASGGVDDDPVLALPGDDRGAARMFELREAVPSSVNSHIAAVKARVHPDIQKTAGDMVVPFSRLEDSIALYRRVFERRDLDYAIWGHASDGNLHPNVVPRALRDVRGGSGRDSRDGARDSGDGRRAARRARRRAQRA